MHLLSWLRSNLWLIIPLFVAAVLFTVNLSRLPLEDADEATYAMVARELHERGEWMRLTLFGNDWVDKPPLHLWSMVISANIFGWNEGALRLPSALFGLAAGLFTALIAYEFTRKKETAFVAALILALFPLFLAAARNIRMDVPVAAAMLGALYFFVRGQERPRYLLGVGICLGIGFLFKSVVALLIIPVLILYTLICRRWNGFAHRELWLGLALGATIAAPWFFLVQHAYGAGFFSEFFGRQVGRVAVNTLQSGITNGYVLWVFFKYGTPWSILVVLALIGYGLLSFKKREREETKKQWRFATFALCSSVLVSLPFFLSTTKLITYFIPTYPFVALFIAAVYSSAAERGEVARIAARVAIALCIVVAIFPSFREAFGKSVLYVSTKSGDEKTVGLLLAETEGETPALLYEFPHDQTIQYYARRRVSHLHEETASALSPPFHLIIPSQLVKDNPWLAGATQNFAGKELSLFHVAQ